MQRFRWRERREKLNWRLLSTLSVSDVAHEGDPAVLEPYALHVTFARLPVPSKDPQTRDNAWFLVRILQLSMEYLLFMRAKDSDALRFLRQKIEQVETERDMLLQCSDKWKARARSGDEQVEKFHQVLQKIATLLQIHGASPSAVATIATLLTNLVSERQAKQERRVAREEDDTGSEVDDLLRSTGPEPQACGCCGKLFSSVKVSEQHRVRRYSGGSIGVETLGKHTIRRNAGEDTEKTEKSVALLASEATIQEIVQRVERGLQQHKEKLRLLVKDEAHKIKQMYEQLHVGTKIAGECETFQLRDELHRVEAQRQLNEVYLQKQKAEAELVDLQKQIQFLILQRKVMRAVTDMGLPTTLSHKSDEALVAVETEINDPQHKLSAVSAELTVSREQALHSPARREKNELVDTFALSRGVSAAVQRNQSSQTELPLVMNKVTQTDEQSSSQQSTSETVIKPCNPICKDLGTDHSALCHEGVDIPAVGFLELSLIDEEVQMGVINDLDSTPILAIKPVALELTSQEPVSVVEASQVTEDAASSNPIVPEDDKRIPSYMHQIYRQDLLDIIAERAQSTASKAANTSPAPKEYGCISQHKCVRSRFQHDEDLVKKRVSSCLLQLEQFARQFGVSTRNAWLSKDNKRTAQQALNGHLEVLPTELLTRMVDCENTVNALIEKEWVSMEKTRLQTG